MNDTVLYKENYYEIIQEETNRNEDMEENEEGIPLPLGQKPKELTDYVEKVNTIGFDLPALPNYECLPSSQESATCPVVLLPPAHIVQRIYFEHLRHVTVYPDNVTEEVALQSFRKYIASSCFNTTSFLDHVKILESEDDNAYVIELVSWWERRVGQWEISGPKSKIQSPSLGTPTGPWDITGQPVTPFTERIVNYKVPFTESAVPCRICCGSGSCPCMICKGTRVESCTICANEALARTRKVSDPLPSNSAANAPHSSVSSYGTFDSDIQTSAASDKQNPIPDVSMGHNTVSKNEDKNHGSIPPNSRAGGCPHSNGIGRHSGCKTCSGAGSYVCDNCGGTGFLRYCISVQSSCQVTQLSAHVSADAFNIDFLRFFGGELIMQAEAGRLSPGDPFIDDRVNNKVNELIKQISDHCERERCLIRRQKLHVFCVPMKRLVIQNRFGRKVTVHAFNDTVYCDPLPRKSIFNIFSRCG